MNGTVYEIIYWVSMSSFWFFTFRNMRSTHRHNRERRNQQAWDKNKIELAEFTGLSTLQIDVAADAAQAVFAQRIHEMQEARRGSGKS
jgi:hypothetical protein